HAHVDPAGGARRGGGGQGEALEGGGAGAQRAAGGSRLARRPRALAGRPVDVVRRGGRAPEDRLDLGARLARGELQGDRGRVVRGAVRGGGGGYGDRPGAG